MSLEVLGIDFSLNGTGLSVYNGSGIVFKKAFTTIKKNFEKDPDTFILIPKFESMEEKLDWVCMEIIANSNYDFVCMEDHIGSYYNWMDGYGIIRHYLRKQNTSHLMISPTALKKFAGCGKADKDKMSEFLKMYYKIDLDYIGKLANNVVDASWLAIVGYIFYVLYIDKNNTDKKVNKSITVERQFILETLNKKYLK